MGTEPEKLVGLGGARVRFDLDLFQALNEEWSQTPLVPDPPGIRPGYFDDAAAKRVRMIASQVPLAGARCLEIGCGRGHLTRAVAEEGGALEVVGLDIRRFSDWDAPHPANVRFMEGDVSQEPRLFAPETFDVIISWSCWEHIRHPVKALAGAHALLKKGGLFYLYANLYRGPSASHAYRRVFFPYPHLLFDDSTYADFMARKYPGSPQEAFEWVNKMVYEQYDYYFSSLGFVKELEQFGVRPLDPVFYARFEEKLGRYPKVDLERDFFRVVLRKAEEDVTALVWRRNLSPLRIRDVPSESLLASPWSRRNTETQLDGPAGDSLRCTIQGQGSRSGGQYGGIRLPLEGATAVCMRVELVNPQHIATMFFDLLSADGKRLARWERHAQRAPVSHSGESLSFALYGGSSGFGLAEAVGVAHFGDLFVRLAAERVSAGFVLHELLVAH